MPSIACSPAKVASAKASAMVSSEERSAPGWRIAHLSMNPAAEPSEAPTTMALPTCHSNRLKQPATDIPAQAVRAGALQDRDGQQNERAGQAIVQSALGGNGVPQIDRNGALRKLAADDRGRTKPGRWVR